MLKVLAFPARAQAIWDFLLGGKKRASLKKPRVPSRKPQAADLAASFQKAVVEALIEKSFLACERHKINTLVVGGGVAANNYLRNKFKEEAESRNPPLNKGRRGGGRNIKNKKKKKKEGKKIKNPTP